MGNDNMIKEKQNKLTIYTLYCVFTIFNSYGALLQGLKTGLIRLEAIGYLSIFILLSLIGGFVLTIFLFWLAESFIIGLSHFYPINEHKQLKAKILIVLGLETLFLIRVAIVYLN
jgi:hypothetical protein